MRYQELVENDTPTFTTAKGSTYRVLANGSTQRTKAARNDVGHEGDFGEKPASEVTYYIDPSEARRLAPTSDEWRLIDHQDGTLSLTTRNADGRWGISPLCKWVPVEREPQVGLLPIELWQPTEVYGRRAYARVHFGNRITSISR